MSAVERPGSDAGAARTMGCPPRWPIGELAARGGGLIVCEPAERERVRRAVYAWGAYHDRRCSARLHPDGIAVAVK